MSEHEPPADEEDQASPQLGFRRFMDTQSYHDWERSSRELAAFLIHLRSSIVTQEQDFGVTIRARRRLVWKMNEAKRRIGDAWSVLRHGSHIDND